jgi:hypothetical protein
MIFPLHVKRIIFCFVYSENHHSSYIYPSLEGYLQPNYIVDVESVLLPQPVHINEHFISIPLQYDQPCDLEEIEIDSKPIQSSTLITITSETCQQIVIYHDQPTTFQIKIRMTMFKPLKMPSHLHPYPRDYYEYLHWFSRENQASSQRHLEPFLDFVDHFQIVHEDVIMRYFSKYLIRDVALWCKGLRANSIGFG